MKKLKKILPIMLAMLMIIGSTLTVSAAELSISEQQIKSIPNDYNYKIAFQRKQYSNWDYQLFVAVFNAPVPLSKNSYLSYSNSDATSYNCYLWNESNKCWELFESKINENLDSYFICEFNDIVWSSYTVTDLDGNEVFQGPVPLIQKWVEPVPEIVQSQTKVILTTAVVCLALLITLFLLSKKLRIFLP